MDTATLEASQASWVQACLAPEASVAHTNGVVRVNSVICVHTTLCTHKQRVLFWKSPPQNCYWHTNLRILKIPHIHLLTLFPVHNSIVMKTKFHRKALQTIILKEIYASQFSRLLHTIIKAYFKIFHFVLKINALFTEKYLLSMGGAEAL